MSSESNLPWKKVTAIVAAVAAGVLSLVYVDVVLRAKESYMRGETYMEWAAHPDEKKAALQMKFHDGKMRLEAQHQSRKISDEEFKREMEALNFDLSESMAESSVKYAYQWYKDTYELFSPPESKWVRMARVKAPLALALWKKELDEMKIPYDDTMLE